MQIVLIIVLALFINNQSEEVAHLCKCANPAVGSTYYEYTWIIESPNGDCCNDALVDPVGQELTYTQNEGVWQHTGTESISGATARGRAACCP
jgi:hypothetical protein